ncbi:hypothetical protein D3C79_591000 [compost metagenome]
MVVGPTGGVGQAEAFAGRGPQLNVAGNVQHRLDLLPTGVDRVAVDECTQFGRVAALEIHLGQRWVEAHFDAPALVSLAPRPATVAGQQLRGAHLAGNLRRVELEHHAAAHHPGLAAMGVEVEGPAQGLRLLLADIRRQVEVQLLVLALQRVVVGAIDLERGGETGPAPVGRPEVELGFHHRPTAAGHHGQAVLFIDTDLPR